MIQVEQRGPYDCMTACIASIFEVPYEVAPILCSPTGEAPEDGWWNAYEAWLALRGWAVMQRVRTTEDTTDPMRCPWSLNSFWLAGVKSPRIDGDHAVVMHGNAIIWDPHPRRDEKLHEGFTSCDYFIPLDPARLVLKPDRENG